MHTSTTTATHSVLKLRTKNFKRPDLANYKARKGDDISSSFSSLESGTIDYDFPPRFSALKAKLIRNPEAVQKSWLRLKERLNDRLKQVEEEGSNFIPQVEYPNLDTLSPSKLFEIKDKGCVIVKSVFPKEQALQFKSDIQSYVKANPHTAGFPKNAKVVYELYWSKAQMHARSARSMRKTQTFMNSLWHADDDSEIVFSQNVMYADRLRIRNPGDAFFSLGPHADGGGIERWEDDEYSSVYSPIFEGNWEDYDPYDATHRVNANVELYGTSAGTCSVFRTFQGWLSMSEVSAGEGTIQLAPLVKEVTAYYMLRPFFDSTDKLDLESTSFPGTVVGKCQEFNDTTHPDLDLSKLMVHIPKVQPGDAVFWHCDLIHAVDKVHNGKSDSSVMYIPSVPLTELNINNSILQRESILEGYSSPDFPSFPFGVGETQHVGRGTAEDVERYGGREALQDHGLVPFDLKHGYSNAAKVTVRKCNEKLFDL